MHLRITSGDGLPIYLQIVNQVKYLAASGRLAPGEPLPSVRALAEQLLINPNTVARAYRELEAAGVVVTRRGAGVYLAEGGSPLAPAAVDKVLNERIDMLLAEASHFGIGLDELARRLRERGKILRSDKP